MTRATLIRAVIAPRWLPLVLAVALLAVAAAVHMAIPWFLGRIIDEGLLQRDAGAVLRWGVALAAVSLVNPLAYTLGHRLLALAEADARRDINLRVNDRAARGGRAAPGRSVGETVNVVTGDNETVASVLSTVGHGSMNLLAFTLGVVLVWTINMWLGLAIAVGVLATTMIAGPLLGRLEERWNRYRHTLATTTDMAADTMKGLRVLRGLGGEQRFLDRYRRQSHALVADSYALSNHSSWIQALQQAIPFVYMTAVIWLGARLALDGQITVGELGAAFGYATGLVMYSGSLLGNAHSIVSIRVAADRIVRHLAPTPATPAPRPATPDLRSVPVARGKLTVLVPARMADAGEAMAAFAEDHAASSALLVADDDYLFAGTLAEVLNVTPGAVDETLAVVSGGDIGTSIRVSEHQTVLDRGLNLSGGQRQRLALARGLARNTAVLLLNDPTSAVDAATEMEIAQRIKQARSGSTTIVATRSLIWRSHADAVVDLRGDPGPLALRWVDPAAAPTPGGDDA